MKKEKMKRPKLGQEVESVSRLVRVRTEDPERGTDRVCGGDMIENPLVIGKWEPRAETVKGIYAGFRSISDTETDCGYSHERARTFEAWIVYTHERRKPVYVLPIDVLEWDGAKTTEESDLYSIVDSFGEKMKTKIYESLAAGKFGWNTASRSYCHLRMDEESMALTKALIDGKPEAIANECAKVANSAMFIWASTRGEKV